MAKWTRHTQIRFLEALRQTANVMLAAEAVGFSRSRIYERRQADPDFATAWDETEQEAADRLEAEAWRRAVQGTEEPIYQKGQLVGYARRHSDGLLIHLLKAHKPAKYRDKTPKAPPPRGELAQLFAEISGPPLSTPMGRIVLPQEQEKEARQAERETLDPA